MCRYPTSNLTVRIKGKFTVFTDTKSFQYFANTVSDYITQNRLAVQSFVFPIPSLDNVAFLIFYAAVLCNVSVDQKLTDCEFEC